MDAPLSGPAFWRSRGIYLAATATGAYFVGVTLRITTSGAILAPTVAAVALTLWAAWAARRHAYAPLATLPVAASIALWAYLDLGLNVGPRSDPGLQMIGCLLAGLPAVIAVLGLALLGSFASSLPDPVKPSLGDSAIRVAAWLTVLTSIVLLLAAGRSFWGRPTPTEYLASIPVAARLPPLVEGQPQDHTIGRFNIRRRRIDAYCPFRVGVSQPAETPDLFYVHNGLFGDDDGSPPHIGNTPFKDCGELSLRIDHAHGFVLMGTDSGTTHQIDFHKTWPCDTCPRRLADLTGPPHTAFIPPILGLALAVSMLSRRHRRPGGEGARMIQGELDDEVGKLYLDDRQTPIPWRDAHTPGGRVVVVMSGSRGNASESFRASARDDEVLAVLPGTVAELGHEERVRRACLALAAVVVSAAPLAVIVWFWRG